MLLGFTNTKLSSSHKLLSHNNLSFFGGKSYLSIFLKNRTLTPVPFVKLGNSNIINSTPLYFAVFWLEGGSTLEETGHRFVLKNCIPVNLFK